MCFKAKAFFILVEGCVVLRQESYKISFVDCQVEAEGQVETRPTWPLAMAMWQCPFVMIISYCHMMIMWDLGLLRNLLNAKLFCVYLAGSTHLTNWN